MFETQPTNGQNGKTHDPLDLIIPMRLISSASMFSDLSSFSLPSEKKGTDATSVEMTSPTSPDFKAGSTSACAAVSPAESNPVKNDAEIGSPRVESQPNSYINRSSLAKFFGAVEGTSFSFSSFQACYSQCLTWCCTSILICQLWTTVGKSQFSLLLFGDLWNECKFASLT